MGTSLSGQNSHHGALIMVNFLNSTTASTHKRPHTPFLPTSNLPSSFLSVSQVFEKMTKRSFSDCEMEKKTTAIRKSPRIHNQKTSTSQKPISKANRVCTSPISLSEKPQFTSPLRSMKNDDFKDTHSWFPENFAKNLVSGSKIYSKSANGLRNSTKKMNGVEGFQSLRRSPRFSTNVSTSELPTVDNREIRRLLSDFSDKSVVNQKENSEKMRIRSSRVKGFAKDEVNTDVGIMAKMEEGRICINAVPLKVVAVEKRGEKKRGNATSRGGTEMVSCKKKNHDNKENCGFQELGGKSKRTHLASPLGSIQNICLQKNCEGYPEKMSKKLVRSVGGVEKAAEPISGSRTGKIDGDDRFQGLRRSLRFSNREAVPVIVSCNESSPAKTPNEGEEKKRVGNRVIKENWDNRTTGEAENCGFQGWTKEQEAALQRAYFAAKPSPHFWKKVSKQVPGKSAQECFDKIHSDLATPPQPQPRSRAKRTNFSPLGHLSLSESKLLEPTELNIKWPKNKRRKGLLAQKTLRHLVQKTLDQDYKADLFSVLEPVANTSTQVLTQTKIVSTPRCLSKKPGFIQEFLEKSPTAQHKPLSRFSNSFQTALVSPPVLKQVKNKALHEKYIDQLHCREAKRMAGRSKCISTLEDLKENPTKEMNVVNAAKNALVSDARDMINQLQHLQTNVTSNSEDSCNDDNDDEEVEGDLNILF